MKLAQPVFNQCLLFAKLLVKTFKFFLLSSLAGLLGAVLLLTPLGVYLEEEFGLTWLFSVRGEIAPPKDVAIISVDQTSAEILHLPDDPEKWPREYYARLLNRINAQQPAIIALNMVFNENRDPQSDQLLAEAIAANNNVILSNYLKHKIIPMSGTDDAVSYESIIESIDIINAAALYTAPFLIPKTSSTVKQFWTNKDSAGDLRTFPDIVFQSYVFKTAYRDIMALLKAINPALAAKYPDNFVQFAGNQAMLDNIEQIQSAFAKFNNDSGQLEQLIAKATFPVKSKYLLSSWLDLLHNQKSLYLNHYGNVGTITTIPFYQVLEQLQPDIVRDKIVMIGFSESIEPEKNLGFYTVFSNAHGQTASPVEIAATAIGNLVDNIWLKPLDPAYQFLLPLLWGIVLSVLCLSCPFHVSMGLTLLLGSTYLYVAYYEFVTAQVWLPLVVPIGLQMPVILIAASILYFRRTQQAKYKMQLVLRHLLPKEIVDNIPYQPENRVMSTGGKLMQGVCLATDVNDYTKLSESMKPGALIELMNAYFADIFPLVTDHGGYITDLAGDGMYAVWLNPEHNKQPHINACHAALAIKTAVSQFNQTGQPALITRFGLAYGEISIGHTGAPGRYVYRAIGDPVNTASRIEGLNKYLGTHILVTAEVIDELEGFLLRDLGLFLLKGKSKPVHVFELLMAEAQAKVCARTLSTAFAKALNLFKAKQWTTALAAFVAINNDFPDDGPTRFFIRYLQFLATLPEASLNKTTHVIDISHITF